MDVLFLHHVLIPVKNLDAARIFYKDILELEEMHRPTFPHPGAWFHLGPAQQLHLVVYADATTRGDKGVDVYDVHLALRIKSYRETLEFLRAKGFREDVDDRDPRKMTLRSPSMAGHPQIYILDPDRNIVEFNAEKID